MKQKDYILFINHIHSETIVSLKNYSHKTGKEYTTIVIKDNRIHKDKENSYSDITLFCDLTKHKKIAEVLFPYKNNIVAAACFGERNLEAFKKIIPHLPYIKTPIPTSIQWATNKILMRQLFTVQNKKISPKFLVINDRKEETIALVKKKINFPLVLKPASLASSLLVTMCFHEEDVADALKHMFNKIKKHYKQGKIELTPTVLVEEFMDGEMYSVDVYIDDKGNMQYCPLVHIKTGRAIGFEDFFGYQRITPTTLSKEEKEKAKFIASESIKAINLRNSTAHVELMKTDLGWKVIELGARVGGFRHDMYNLSFGINHNLNDILIKLGKKPKLPTKTLGHTAMLKFYSKKEGKLEKITGLKKINKLASIHKVKINKNPGDKCLFSKNGGKSVLDIILFNNNRSDLLADIRRLEKTIQIKVLERQVKKAA
jgi:biotin carboxylase